MKNSNSKHYDLTVIGAGVAGMAAALFAAQRGLKTALVGVLGETWFTGGLFDILGVHPLTNPEPWTDPFDAILALKNDVPGHPYARLSINKIKTAAASYLEILEDFGLPYYVEEDRNLEIITAMGAVKTTYALPKTMREGVFAWRRKAPCLIVDIKGLKGFSASLIAERLGPHWPGLQILNLPSLYSDEIHEIAPLPLARDLESSDLLEKTARLISPHVQDVEYVGLPAVIGVDSAHKLIQELSLLLGKKVFEIPAMPPSIPGIRLKETLFRALAANDVKAFFQKKVLRASRAESGEFFLDMGVDQVENTITAEGVILAAGGFLGGGLTADRQTVREPLFDLPVFQPQNRKNWHEHDFFAAEGHALNRSGLETDDRFRPLAANGRPAFVTLFAAGDILAHQDWMRMKCGSGMSVASAYQAVASFAALKGRPH